MIQSFVLDSSAAISWCLEDEGSANWSALDVLTSGGLARVPSLWLYEITNAFAVAQRRGRLQSWDTNRHLQNLLNLNIEYDQSPESNTLMNIIMIAAQFNLSSYDAAYLELAIRHQAPLATNDRQLKDAALKSKIKVIWTS